MAITVNPGKGTVLSHGVTTTYTNVAQRVSLDGPEMEVGKADTTHLDSSCKTSRPTIADPGELSGKLWYDPQDAIHKLLFGFIGTTSNTEEFKLVFADATNGPTTWAFNAWLSKFKPTGMEVESNLEADFTLQLISIPVQTP